MAVHKAWKFLVVFLVISCDLVPHFIYSSVDSPSKTVTAIKEYNGDENVSWNVQLITHTLFGKVTNVVLQDQPLNNIFGTDGVTLAWESDHHLTLGWPAGKQPVIGPDKIGKITFSYKNYEPDLDRIEDTEKKEIELIDNSLRFEQIDSTTGALYVSTGKKIPRTQCIVKLQGTDPSNLDNISVEIIADGIGRPTDKYPSIGMISVSFSLDHKDHAHQVSLTQGKFGEIDLMNPNSFPHQQTSKIIYDHYQMPAALKLFSDVTSGKVVVKLSYDFGKTLLVYHITLPIGDNTRNVTEQFNLCVSNTNMYNGNFHIPLR